MNDPTDRRGAAPRAEQGAHAPDRICGAEVELLPLYLKALHVIPGDLPTAEPGEVFDPLRCVLEAAHPGLHFSLARGLPVRYPGEVWACWPDGGQPTGAITLPDCPVVDPGDRDEACVLFNDHVGAHSWALADPEDDELRERLGLSPGPLDWAGAPAPDSTPRSACEHLRTEKRDGKTHCKRCKRQIYL